MSDHKDQQRISDAADNCEVLRGRLAKYEDAEGRPLQSGVVDERAAFDEWFCKRHSYKPGTDTTQLSAAFEPFKAWKARAAITASAPSHGEQVRELPPFAQKVISKLKRFEECASDSDAGGVDIGRHWLDLLTQLGLLNRVQRSPGRLEISQQGEDVLASAPSAGSHGGAE